MHAFSHGGLENGIVNIINGSPPEIEHELCLLTAAGEFIHRLHRPTRHYELHKKPGNSAKTILQLRQVIKKSGADIVHTRNWGAFDGVLAACLCPGIAILHGEHGRDMSDPQGLNRRRNLLRRAFARRIRTFTTVSEDLAEWLSGQVRIPKSKIALIPNGVDTGLYHPHRDLALRHALGIRGDDFVVGTIGRLDPVKNHAGLIRAFRAFAEDCPAARLMIVGDGPERERLEGLIQKLNFSSRPVLTGYQSEIHRFYGVFDVFVLNSFAEGMSNTLLEAMASGLPVLCTSVGANPEIVADRVRGRLIPAGDDAVLTAALRDCHDSPELRKAHGCAAESFIRENFSLAAMVRTYADLYLNV